VDLAEPGTEVTQDEYSNPAAMYLPIYGPVPALQMCQESHADATVAITDASCGL
jgi:hypothetical protein